MTVLDWLQSRTPIPPAAMTARIVTALGSRAGDDAAGASALCLDAAADNELLDDRAVGAMTRLAALSDEHGRTPAR